MTEDIRAQIAHLEAEIAHQEAVLARLDAEITELERELDDFRQRYDRLVAPVVTRLEAIKRAIEDLEQSRYLEGLGDIRPLKSYWTPPPDYVSVEEQYRRTWETPSATPPSPSPPRRPRPISSAPDDPALRLKTLYRLLARRYHPDLAADPEERAFRNRLMVLINQAYESGDVDVLQALHDQPEDASADVPLAVLHLRQLQAQLADLAERIAQRRRERHALLHHDLMRLKVEEKLRRAAGRDFLRELADELEQEYWECMARLEALRRR